MAVREGQEHAVKCLVDNKANVSIKDNDGVSVPVILHVVD